MSLIDILVLLLIVWVVLSLFGAPVGYSVGNPIGVVLLVLLLLILLRGHFGRIRLSDVAEQVPVHELAAARECALAAAEQT